MGWSPKEFWRATLPEVVGAIIGHSNKHIEMMKLAWEPARFIAFVTWNANVEKKGKIKSEQQLRRFPWEKREVLPGETKKVIKQVMAFRDVVKNKWGLKYQEDAS